MRSGWHWEREGADWPLRSTSSFVALGHLRWHIQRLMPSEAESPSKPPRRIVLLHGTFSSTHSFRKLGPLLAQGHEVLMPDLPGHGWTQGARASDMAMPNMARLLAALIESLGFYPAVFVGHSAGAALALRLGLTSGKLLESVISLNGALLPLPGLLGHVFAPAAQVLDFVPGLAQFTAWRSRHSDWVDRLLAGTGSVLSPDDVSWYRRLASDAPHVQAVMDMMARWDLAGFAQLLPTFRAPIDLLAASRDATVPASEIKRAALLLPQARCQVLRDLGHLAHEEAPQTVAASILESLNRH